MSDCKFTQEDVRKNLNDNVKTEVKNGETLLTISGYSDFYVLTRDRYLDLRKPNRTPSPDELYLFDSNNTNSFIKTLSEITDPIIFDLYIIEKNESRMITFNQVKADQRGLLKKLDKDFLIQIIDALNKYCNLPADPQGSRFDMETFQKAIEAVDVLYPGIKLSDAVFPSGLPGSCAVMGGRKSRKTRKQRKARKTRKSRRTRRTKRRRSRK